MRVSLGEIKEDSISVILFVVEFNKKFGRKPTVKEIENFLCK